MRKTLGSIFTVLFIGMSAGNAFAEVKTEIVEYKHGNTILEGYMAYDDEKKDLKRPGILIIHEWTGINPYIKKRAEQLAKMGYMAFAADIYGKGVRPQTPQEAGKTSSIYRNDRNLLRQRALAGLSVLKNHRLTENNKIAAIGYCFGGTAALELARSGADLNGTVSFHGGLGTPNTEDAKNIKGKVLVLHGADDPFVPTDEVKTFQEEMRKAGIDWQFVSYGNSVHSFTNPEAGNDNSKGAAYNEKADKRSWEAMKQFFKEIFNFQK